MFHYRHQNELTHLPRVHLIDTQTAFNTISFENVDPIAVIAHSCFLYPLAHKHLIRGIEALWLAACPVTN